MSVLPPSPHPTILGTVVEIFPALPDVPQSEHDPVWTEASVRVDQVISGNITSKLVRVRFAASTDVAWYQAPKLSQGQLAIIRLRNEQGGVYTVREPQDVTSPFVL